MRVGTFGFCGPRLKEARQARGLSATDLADLLGVRPATVSLYESKAGKATPSPQVMDAICARLNFPASYFVRSPAPIDDAGIFWRANSSATRIAQQRAEVRLGWLKELMVFLRQSFDFKPPNFPAVHVPPDFRQITTDQIEDAARKCRLHWGLGVDPVSDVIGEMEGNGIVCGRIKVGAENLDAFSQRASIDGTPYVLLSSDKESACRSRFDAAHELGHMLLHQQVDQRGINNTKDWRVLEDQAHRFASAFLLPAEAFSKEVWGASLDTFVAIKPKWRASVGAMIMRSRHLRLIDEDQEKRLWINRSRRGWQKAEPLDERLEYETPTLVSNSIRMLVDANVRKREQILAEIHLSAADAEEISGVPFGYFRERTPTARPTPKPGVFGPADEVPQSNVISLGQFRRP